MGSAANPMYGVVNINGNNYLERWQIIPIQVSVTVNAQIIAPFTSPLPGVYDFRLKALTRETLVNGAPAVRRFRFKLGNSDGAIWYSQGGLGSTTDRVLDSLMFGNGQFPYPIIPALFYGKNASFNMEVEDLSNAVPYTIAFAFHGAYLIPVGS